jgi:hypothetical protein
MYDFFSCGKLFLSLRSLFLQPSVVSPSMINLHKTHKSSIKTKKLYYANHFFNK